MLRLLCLLWILGAVLFLVSVGTVVRTVHNPSNRSMKNRMIPVLLSIFGCTWALRAAVGVGSVFFMPEQLGLDLPSSLFEILGDSIVHTMQTFSMDEDYTTYLTAGKKLLEWMGMPVASYIYGVCVTILHVAAPVAGGAILLDLLCDFFPAMRYSLQRAHTKYIFNELNDASILLAESIREKQSAQKQQGNCERVGIVFTNTTIDFEDEHENHLYARVQAIGARCVTRDVFHFPIRSIVERIFRDTQNVIYLLISENQADNLDTALRLKKLPNIGVHAAAVVRSDNSADGELLDQANNSGNEMLLFLLQDKTNTVLRLLVDHPLFVPLLRGGYGQLEVLVVGSGSLAEEYICQSAWCGQMLDPGTRQHLPFVIRVLAEGQEQKEQIEQAVRRRMPVLFTAVTNHLVQFEFYSAHPDSAAFSQMLEQHGGNVSTAVICLEDNDCSRRAALSLKLYFDRRELGERRQVSLLCFTPLQGIADTFSDSASTGCAIHPFGMLEERYSLRQVFMEDLLYYTVCMNNAYSQTDEQNQQEMRALLRSSYRLNSSLSSAIHFTYKLFSAGALRSEKDLPAEESDCAARFEVQDPVLLDTMAWLEHIRWCVYVWSLGYRAPTPSEQQWIVEACGDTFDHKSLPLRLHPCLVLSRPGSAFRENPDLWDTITPDQMEELDPLDQLSFSIDALARKFYAGKDLPLQHPDGRLQRGLHTDFKEYDYRMVQALPGNLQTYIRKRKEQKGDLTLSLLLDRM